MNEEHLNKMKYAQGALRLAVLLVTPVTAFLAFMACGELNRLYIASEMSAEDDPQLLFALLVLTLAAFLIFLYFSRAALGLDATIKALTSQLAQEEEVDSVT